MALITFCIYCQAENPSDLAVKACNNSAPFILIDVFQIEPLNYGHRAQVQNVGGIDVDGDGATDVLHGDFVSRVFKTSGKKLERFGLRAYSEQNIKAALGDLRYLIKIGKIAKPAGIIMPISFSLKPEVIEKRYLPVPDKIDDIASYKKTFQAKVLQVDGPGTKFTLLQSFFDSFKKLNIPFFVPAGNNYSTKINMAGLLGAETIGALHYNEKKIAAYSDRSGITTIMRNGDILSHQTIDGIDINLDGKADFLKSELSNGPLVVTNRGHHNLPILQEYDSSIPSFFMKSYDFNRLYGINDINILNQIDQDYGEFIHFPSGHYYRMSNNGNMIFLPFKTSTPYVQHNYGTSFAIGNICQ